MSDLLTMYDAWSVENIPAAARFVAAYMDGPANNLAKMKARFPHATVLTITTFLAEAADCCDCETEDLTIFQAEAWVQERLASGVYRPVVYANQDRWLNQGLQSVLAKYGTRIRRWIAAYPGAGPTIPGGFDAHQWSSTTYDQSVCLPDFFDGPPKPKPPAPKSASAELQLDVGEGMTGTARVLVSYNADKGTWSTKHVPGVRVRFRKGGGTWRVRGIPFNSPPLDGPKLSVVAPPKENTTLPSLTVIKQYLATSVLPVFAGVSSNWLVTHISWFAQLGVSQKSIAGVITQVGVFGITAALAWLAAHHILAGHYAPTPTPVAPVAPASLASVPTPPVAA